MAGTLRSLGVAWLLIAIVFATTVPCPAGLACPGGGTGATAERPAGHDCCPPAVPARDTAPAAPVHLACCHANLVGESSSHAPAHVDPGVVAAVSVLVVEIPVHTPIAEIRPSVARPPAVPLFLRTGSLLV